MINVSDYDSEAELEPTAGANVVSALHGLTTHERITLAKKVEEILSSDTNICRAPGASEKIYLTTASDPKRFHTVTATAKSGKISCDCLTCKSTGLCFHAIAVAVKGDLVNDFVSWFNKSNSKVNLDVVLNHGIAAANGSKPSRRTQVRTHGRKNSTPVERIVKSSVTTVTPVNGSGADLVNGPTSSNLAAAPSQTAGSRLVLYISFTSFGWTLLLQQCSAFPATNYHRFRNGGQDV